VHDLLDDDDRWLLVAVAVLLVRHALRPSGATRPSAVP
jgi:hypothetical protein